MGSWHARKSSDKQGSHTSMVIDDSVSFVLLGEVKLPSGRVQMRIRGEAGSELVQE